MGSKRYAGIIVVLLSTSFAAAAAAADSKAAEKEIARGLMDEGHAKDERGDHKGALESFRAADNLMHVPTTALEVARQEIALGLLVDARDTLLRVRRSPVVAGEPAVFEAARDQAAVLDNALTSRIPSLHLSITGVRNLATAKITIDGTQVPGSVADVPFRVNPGHHVVSITGENGSHAQREVDVAEGSTAEVALTMTAGPAAAPSDNALARDGQTGHEAQSGGAPSWLRWGGAGLAVAGLGVGVLTGIISLSSTSSAKSVCSNGQCPPPSWGDLSTARTTATISDVAFVAAGVGAAAFAASFLWSGSSPSQKTTATRVVPWIGPGSAGMSGAF